MAAGRHDAALPVLRNGNRIPDRRSDGPFLCFFRLRDHSGRGSRHPARIIQITLLGVATYLAVISANNALSGTYVMRAVYLAIAGYLVGFFAQQRARYENRVREFEAQAERHSIARLLHDSYVQSLAEVNLRLETCRELLRRGRPEDGARELKELQFGVKRQYDEVREYVRSLAGVDSNSAHEVADIAADPKVQINGVFNGSSRLGEQILQIMLRGAPQRTQTCADEFGPDRCGRKGGPGADHNHRRWGWFPARGRSSQERTGDRSRPLKNPGMSNAKE